MAVPPDFSAQLDAELAELLLFRERTMLEFHDDYRPLNMYAIYRKDLDMPPEKLASQCGHAFEKALREAQRLRPELAEAYPGTGEGTKVIMYARNRGQLVRGWKEARYAGFPCRLIIDRGTILLPHFTGKPVITALGIGPVYKDEVAEITKRFTMSNPETIVTPGRQAPALGGTCGQDRTLAHIG